MRTSVLELVEEQQRADLLRSYNLEPRHRVLLVGPPGNGKTTLAEAIASALMVPFLVVRYEGVIASFLGETTARLHLLLDAARTRRCVLFFDEFDAIAKERGDVHETGEIKRVVSSLLLQIDSLPSYVTVVVATNHPELLDRAVWRRFQLRLELPAPTPAATQRWVDEFAERLGEPLGVSSRTVTAQLRGRSFSELEDFGLDVMRRRVLGGPETPISSIVRERLSLARQQSGPLRQ
ncbi:MAG: ATP-binding protein [Chloroflexota bacterium]